MLISSGTSLIAYADPAAGERGRIYKACNWRYIGIPPSGEHLDFTKDGVTITSYQFNRKSDKMFEAPGWDGVQPKYDFLRENQWQENEDLRKHKWVVEAGGRSSGEGMECNALMLR